MNADDLTNVPTSALVERTVTSARSEPVLQSREYWEYVRVLPSGPGETCSRKR